MNIKQEIIKELNKTSFPDLKLIYSNEALDCALEILLEELKKEEKDFKEFLKIKKEKLNFDSFEKESILYYYWEIINHYDNISDNKKTRKIIEEFRPKLEDFLNEVSYSKKYFDMINYVNENCDLDEEQKRVLYLRIKSYKERWIDLDKHKQNKLKKINKKLSKISNKFWDNLSDSQKEFRYLIKDFDSIKDLPKEVLDITKKAWEEKWWYLFNNDPASCNAIMRYCTDKKIRKDFEVANYSYASKWKYDNRKNILKLLELKKEKAKILWFKNYWEYSINKKMASSVQIVLKLLESIHKKAKKKAKKDLDNLKKYYNLKELKSYDVSFYSRKYKEENFKLDDKELKKYFELEEVLSYLHSFIEKFYSIEIKKVDIKSYDEEVRVYEIYKDKELISYYFLDPFFREWKRQWAWANSMRSKEYINKKIISIIYNICNFQKSLDWKTTLSLGDVETLFHEFWHAIHEILSESPHSELSWFWVEWDFVEVPSQLLENWVRERESIKKFAKHIDTWKTIPDNILDTLEKTKNFMIWNFWLRQIEFAILDMKLYTEKPPKTVQELDEKYLHLVNKYSIFKRKKDYKMYTWFSHIFDGWYSAWYYSYLWAEIIEADIYEKIKELWIFKASTGKKLFDTIIWQWTKKDAVELFNDFMWRELDAKAFYNRYEF